MRYLVIFGIGLAIGYGLSGWANQTGEARAFDSGYEAGLNRMCDEVRRIAPAVEERLRAARWC